MQRSDFFFRLPAELIAQYPTERRTDSRLLELDRKNGNLRDRVFSEFPSLLKPGDLLVLNNTRVIPARLFGHKSTGGKVELLVERIKDEHCVLAHLRASKSPRPGTELQFEDVRARVEEREEDLFQVRFEDPRPVSEILQAIGHMPLPPYIERDDELSDQERYQTVYAQEAGAVAAPTAGLHFDQATLEQLHAAGVGMAWVTLHVGAGTFQPVRVENIREHRMHSEWIRVSTETCEQIARTKAAGGRVIAVGTTSVRCLETAARQGELQPYEGETDIFIFPGYPFQVVDGLLTNFHLPESTLLMLVCAFAGYEVTMNAYRYAVAQKYRFFSYGDAMLIL